MKGGGFIDPAKYNVDKLRGASGLDEAIDKIETDTDDTPDPTHECMTCQLYRTHIESCPIKTYYWCEECESVNLFKRIDRM